MSRINKRTRKTHPLVVLPLLLLCACSSPTPPDSAGPQAAVEPAAVVDPAPQGPDAVVTILTTNGADFLGAMEPLKGEWSFAAWIEVDDRAFLFDTGWSPDNVFSNAEILGIDLSIAEDLILSHNHPDHTGGLELLRTELSKRNPNALRRIHVAEGIFDSRPGPDGSERNPMIEKRERLEALGSEFIIYTEPTEIASGVWVTGPVPRVHPETNYPTGAGALVVRDGENQKDTIAESQSLVVLATGGPVFVSGCGHAGLINTLAHGRDAIADQRPQAAIGGFHLAGADDETLRWTAERLAEVQLGHFVGGHCTGFETVVTLRELADLPRDRAVIGAIGTRFETGVGIVPGNINQ